MSDKLTTRNGATIEIESIIEALEAARRLLPIAHFMARHGLRIEDVLTLRLEEEGRFSAKGKGGVVRSFELVAETIDQLRGFGSVRREPFKGVALSTVQRAIRKLTGDLADRGRIRHRYSAHDFRHYFAIRLYRETGDVYRIKKALGHATVSVTEVYLAGLGAGE